MRRIAFYGGSFDPVHRGHLAVAHALIGEFTLDEFVFIPAFHAPHKGDLKPTSAYDRYAMLCLVTRDEAKMKVSRIEIEAPHKPYSVETLDRLNEIYSDDVLFFVMGADSWMEITEWRQWETVLALTNHIVVTRPGSAIDFSHVSDAVRERIVDVRNGRSDAVHRETGGKRIFITDRVNIDVSATSIRHRVRENDDTWILDVPPEVAIYIEKYQIYN